eukprot:TRINITY_DN94151_c0_g1_i1.p1 TRINITY_DN94151_c0_g1~~TRINITY_DN94151_c0_g1_i1.p1  ORF type:complete len:305 (+),score=75.82 TRINITY_DN94151_c0_g1_i1:115-1029(+)
MAGDAPTSLVVLLLALFVVPRVMQYIPDFDPLMLIMGLVGLLALLQHLGIAQANIHVQGASGGMPRDDEDDLPSRRRNGGRSSQDSSARDASPKDLLGDAERCLEQNNYARVVDLSNKVLGEDPENARAWELLVTAQKWSGKRSEALATVKKARDLYEVESKALRELAKELEKSHDPAATAKENEKKGEEFMAKRQYDLAMECFSKAIEVLGDSQAEGAELLPLHRRRAECAQQLQEWGVCRRDATVVLEADANDQKALLQRAAANEALEKFSAALEDARKLLSLDPRSTAANRIVNNCKQALR